MKTYNIEVQEFLARVIEVKAKSFDDAVSKVKKEYINNEIVLDYNDFVEADFIDIDKQSKSDEINHLISEIIEFFVDDEKRYFQEFEKKLENQIYTKLLRIKELL
jgi:hypothetical protein